MASDGDGRRYDLTEIFVIKFVLADVVIVAALLFAGPIYAVAITALLVVSVFLVWYLTERVGRAEAGGTASTDGDPEAERDPLTILQERYAAGELSEAAFEEKVERIVTANERAERAGVETGELSFERAE